MSTYADITLPDELYQVVENQHLEIQASILLMPPKNNEFKSMSMILMKVSVK